MPLLPLRAPLPFIFRPRKLIHPQGGGLNCEFKKQAGGLQTRLTAGDNPRINRSLHKFNAGGVVRPRPASHREAK